MQVYRGMDVGTAKPSPAERATVRHHLLDVLDPWEDASVAWYQHRVGEALADIEARGRRALLVGGTALWVQAVVDALDIPGRFPAVRTEIEADPDTLGLHRRLASLDPVAAARMDPANRRRVVRALEVTIGSGRPFSSYGPGLTAHPPTPFRLVGLHREREALDARIEGRYAAQMAAGFLDEVAALRALPRSLSRTASQALGYKELLAHLAGQASLDEALQLAIARTRRFARRQQAWFRRDPRIAWLDATAGAAEVADRLAAVLDPASTRSPGP
jgi:tRNA dimethylallyltransferase